MKKTIPTLIAFLMISLPSIVGAAYKHQNKGIRPLHNFTKQIDVLIKNEFEGLNNGKSKRNLFLKRLRELLYKDTKNI